MTEKELRDRTKIEKNGWSSYKVTIEYRGKEYYCSSNNSIAWDDLHTDGHRFYYTKKQCLIAFYEECKQKNNLR